MRVEETFSRFHHSFPFGDPDNQLEVGLLPMWPGFDLYEYQGVAVAGYYINFSPACPPVTPENLPVLAGKHATCLLLAGSPRFGPQVAFWYSAGSIARAMNRV